MLLHGINQAHAVGEVGLVARDDVQKLGQLLRRHREVGIEDHQHIARRGREPGADGVSFTSSGLAQADDFFIGVRGCDSLDLAPRVIAGVSFDEDQLDPGSHRWNALDGGGDVTRFVTRWDHHRNARGGSGPRARPTRGDEDGEAEPLQQRGDPAVGDAAQAESGERRQNASGPRDRTPSRELHEIQHIRRGQPAVLGLPRLQSDKLRRRKERPPEGVLEVNRQTRPRMRNGMQPFEQCLHIGGEVERVRNDDEIERTAQPVRLQVFPGLDEKASPRQPLARGRDAGLG